MRYKMEWRGHLRLTQDKVLWDGQVIGTIKTVYRDGATSPGGMVTNTVFVTQDGKEYQSKTDAIEALRAAQKG